MIRYEDSAELKKVLGQIDLAGMWAITKFAKHVRGRCRSNSALNNYLNRMFEGQFRFETVTKYNKDGSSYPGLKITDLGTQENTEGDDE